MQNETIPAIQSDILTINNKISGIEELNYTLEDNYYINANGVKTYNTSFNMTTPIHLLKGTVLHLFAKGYTTSVTILAQANTNGQGNYNPVVICPDGNARWYHIPITRTGNYIISSSKSAQLLAYVINAFQLPTNDVSLSMFLKFGVIGDSYASGVIYETYGSSDEHYENSWGQIMARKFGTTCTNYSHGGLSTRTWLTHEYGLTKLLAADPDDIYYCALGINDYSQLGIEYLGTIEDIDDEDYTQNADTFYGNYGKIISNIKIHAPDALIVMFTCANTAEVPSQFSEAIIAIANHFNIPYIVQAEDPFFQSYIYTNMTGGHPTSIGYGGMANAFERLLQGSIQEHPDYYANAYKKVTP